MSVEEELRDLAASLNPPAFFARIDLWRKGGIAGNGMSERVGGSRGAKLPTFDRTDIALNEAERQYREHLQGVSVAMSTGDEREARKLLQKARALEVKWLFPIETASEWVQKMADGDPTSCNTCGVTKDAWVRKRRKAGVKTPLWRLRAGDCQACYRAKRRAVLAEVEQAVAS